MNEVQQILGVTRIPICREVGKYTTAHSSKEYLKLLVKSEQLPQDVVKARPRYVNGQAEKGPRKSPELKSNCPDWARFYVGALLHVSRFTRPDLSRPAGTVASYLDYWGPWPAKECEAINGFINNTF